MSSKQLGIKLSECGGLPGGTLCQQMYSEGYEAGWRGDELIFKKPECYMSGYEAGQTAKELYKEGLANARAPHSL